jgi:DNA-binding transcriptional LysR family regulator
VELRHLRNFVAIAEERSFTRAAERLWVAQPGLSAQIRQLEDELDVRLFDRHTRGVDLTDAGELFLERARIALSAAEHALATGQDLAGGLIGSIRVGVAMSARSVLGQRLLETFGVDRPRVEVTVVEAYGGVLVGEVATGRLDAAIVPVPFTSPELHHASLGAEPLIVAVGAEHRLAGSGPVSMDELVGEEVMVTGHRHGAAFDSAVTGVLGAAGVSHSTQAGGWGPSMFDRVADGHSVALTTRPTVDRPGILARELDPPQAMPFALVWRAHSPTPPLAGLIQATSALTHRRSARPPAPALLAA